MVDIMDKIDTDGKQTLQEIFMGAESSGVGRSVRKIWEDDKRNTKDVKKDQKRKCSIITIITTASHIIIILTATGKKGNRWVWSPSD